MYASFLESRTEAARELVRRLSGRYEYVSLLGKLVTGKSIAVTTFQTHMSDTREKQCGFVVKLFTGKVYSEYSFDDITPETIDALEQKIIGNAAINPTLLERVCDLSAMADEPLKKDFRRPLEGREFSTEECLERLGEIKNAMASVSDKVIQASASLSQYETSALFLTKNRELTQNYTWVGVSCMAVARSEKGMQNYYTPFASDSYEQSFAAALEGCRRVAQTAVDLLDATAIEPGYYEIITEPSITGLIAHEAFGHGVEMDMFVKNRAKSVHYLNKPVASPLVEMHDGAAACLSAGSYFFDDDGVLAHDTLIIKDGILQTGISDAVSALQLGTDPTGNGRRESTRRKAYTRMTNTFFAPRADKVEDMIASVKHGYLLAQTSNGMEDPKNWNIQCVCMYGREIKDGKFTGKLVAPVVMSGYVPDLLMSITMVSDSSTVIGSGHCGKGYKETVAVADGGPYLKGRCKLG